MTNPTMQPCFFHQITGNAASATHQRKRLGLLFPLLAPSRLFCLALSFYSNCVNTSSPHPFLVGSPLGGFTSWGSAASTELGSCSTARSCSEMPIKAALQRSDASEQTFAHTSEPLSLSVSFSLSSWGKVELEETSGDVRKGIKV